MYEPVIKARVVSFYSSPHEPWILDRISEWEEPGEKPYIEHVDDKKMLVQLEHGYLKSDSRPGYELFQRDYIYLKD